MTPQDITSVLSTLFEHAVNLNPPDCWQVELGNLRLLVLLSEDQTWLRALVSITSAQAAQPFWEKLLEANFDATQEVRYALHDNVLWGVYQHSLAGLSIEDFQAAITRLMILQRQGLEIAFNDLVDGQMRQIILAAKRQGQSLESTLQTLQRLYEEGVMGDLQQDSQQRQATLEAWRYRLAQLWSDVEP